MKTKTRWMMILASIAGFLCLSGCNTSEGFGEDLEQVGGEIQEEADR